jgi:hypothetical protein
MKRIVITGLAVAAALAAAPSASAKGFIQGIKVCGTSACGTVTTPRAALHRFGARMLSDATPRVESPPILPYYRVRFVPRYELPDGDTFYIPGANVICTDRGCIDVPQGLTAGLSAAAESAGALTPHISAVMVGKHRRADRSAFAIMFDQRPEPAPSDAVWESPHTSIVVEFGRVTPWSLGGASWMAYYPSYHLLSRDGRWFHAGPDVDRLVRGGAAADAADGHGWGMAAAVVVVLAAAAGAGRRLRRPGTG